MNRKPRVRRSSKWPRLEKAFLRKNPRCAVCGTKERLQVHHRRPVHLWPELELRWSNLVVLCQPHHLLFGHRMLWSSFNETIDHDIREWRKKIKDRPDGHGRAAA